MAQLSPLADQQATFTHILSIIGRILGGIDEPATGITGWDAGSVAFHVPDSVAYRDKRGNHNGDFVQAAPTSGSPEVDIRYGWS